MNTLFLTELARGMALTLKYFFDKKVTVSSSMDVAVCDEVALVLEGCLEIALREESCD